MAPHLNIFVAEDNADDRKLLEHCLKGEKIGSVRFFQDGEELMEYCDKHDRMPFLLLLDLKMPHGDGFAVLDFLKHAKKLQCNPVIVLSSSQEPVDIRKAYHLGANAYLEKPRDLPGYKAMVRAIRQFWVEQNKAIGPG